MVGFPSLGVGGERLPGMETSIVHLLTPFYSMISVNDPEHYADPEAAHIIKQARDSVVAATAHTVLIVTAQDLLQVQLDLQVWNGTPPFRVEQGWSRSATHTIECPSGGLSVVPTTGSGFGSGPLPAGPDNYRIEVLWRGREGAEVRARETRQMMVDMSAEDAQQVVDRFAGLEKYRIRVWPDAP